MEDLPEWTASVTEVITITDVLTEVDVEMASTHASSGIGSDLFSGSLSDEPVVDPPLREG